MPFALIAAANTAIAAAKAGCQLYRDIKNAAGDVKDVLDDLKSQFSKIQNPTNEQKIQFNEEVHRVQKIAKSDPNDALGEIGEHLGKFLDAYDSIEKLFLQEERESKKVYKGEESIGRRALRRVLIRSRLSSMYADIRTEMTYNAPAELGDLYTRFEKMWSQIQEEQRVANAEEMRAIQLAIAKRRRMIRKFKENATWFGAVLFVTLWLISLLILIRTSKTMSLGYY
jgi:hypothetical protein